jgi:hypothetical protein
MSVNDRLILSNCLRPEKCKGYISGYVVMELKNDNIP